MISTANPLTVSYYVTVHSHDTESLRDLFGRSLGIARDDVQHVNTLRHLDRAASEEIYSTKVTAIAVSTF
jgi:hypothetical protein